MSFSSIKKFFGVKKNKNKTQKTDRIDPLQVKQLEVFRPVPHLVVQRIEDVKSTLTEITLAPEQQYTMIHHRHQQFIKKLNLLVKDLKENVLIREYVKHVYSKNEQMVYNQTLEKLSQNCDELSFHLKNMLFFNIRNSRTAEMIHIIDQTSKKHKERKRQVCIDVELCLKQRITHKWSILKTSTDKQLLEKFLKEIIGQKKAIQCRQIQAARILSASQFNASKNRQWISIDDATTMVDDEDYKGDDDDDDNDNLGESTCDGSTAAAALAASCFSIVVGQNVTSSVAPEVLSTTV